MSTAKDRMRHNKMKNQPTNVTYSSWQQCLTGGGLGGRTNDPQQKRGPPQYGRPLQDSGWVRGRQDGGVPLDQALPKYITASLFAKARAAEVNAMLNAVSKTTGSCHVFSALPKHMRRRAMSHNTKRLPCRLREIAHRMLEKSQQAGQKEKKVQSKTKSRRARRRHGNLLLEFNRRQRKNKWLETHIWHAKRFHMLKKWGYCLGDRPTDKCYRASYRAMSAGCLLQDLSYFCCVELQGPEEQLLSALSRLTNKETGPTFAAALYMSGKREGNTLLYRPDQYPHQPLGPVHFLWRPRIAESTNRQLWLWVNPSLKQDLLPELQTVCQCFEEVSPAVETIPSNIKAESDSTEYSEPHCLKRKRKRNGDGNDDPATKILGDGTQSLSPVSWKSSKTAIVINDLSMEILRYRLIGPLSHSVLTKTLLPATNSEVDTNVSSPFWWPEQCKKEQMWRLHQQQSDIFQLLKGVVFRLGYLLTCTVSLLKGVHSTSALPAGCVLGLTVDDPRLILPKEQEKAVSDLQGTHGVDEELRKDLTLKGIPAPCAQSALWDQSVRDNVTYNKISEQTLNRMKRQLLVPGSRLATPLQGRVPILLVHQAGKQQGVERQGWGSGWDLLLPKGWGMAFWVPLVYRGVRVGGLQMSLKHSQNKCMPHFPQDFPDCPAGARFQEQQAVELLEIFKRHPPSKRTNYIKHGCLAPFRCPWQQLADEWEEIVKQDRENGEPPSAKMKVLSSSEENIPSMSAFIVLRSRNVLRQLSNWCKPSSRTRRVTLGCPNSLLSPAVAVALQTKWSQNLVWVRVCVLGKGLPMLHAMLCVPTSDDLQNLRRNPQYSVTEEARHTDHFKDLMKQRNKRPKTSSQCLTLRKKKDCTPAAMKEDPNPFIKKEQNSGFSLKEELLSILTPPLEDPRQGSSTSCQIVDLVSAVESSSVVDCGNASRGLVQGLWPEPLPSVTSHCSRVTLGWVTQGDFSLATGGGEALGFVTLTGLLHMLKSQPEDQRGIVLLRNPSSLQYRYAQLHVEA